MNQQPTGSHPISWPQPEDVVVWPLCLCHQHLHRQTSSRRIQERINYPNHANFRIDLCAADIKPSKMRLTEGSTSPPAIDLTAPSSKDSDLTDELSLSAINKISESQVPPVEAKGAEPGTRGGGGGGGMCPGMGGGGGATICCTRGREQSPLIGTGGGGGGGIAFPGKGGGSGTEFLGVDVLVKLDDFFGASDTPCRSEFGHFDTGFFTLEIVNPDG